MPNPISDFKNDHHVILGIALILIGGFGVIGSITGRLPAMLAGLFDPGDLSSTAASSGNTPPSQLGAATSVQGASGTGITSDLLSGSSTSGLSSLVQDAESLIP